MINNRCVLQHHHVDCTIVDTLLKEDTKKHADGWDTSNKGWTPFNDVTKDAGFYDTTSRFVTCLGGFPRNVIGCGCQRTIFGTHPHGHRLHFFYFVTSTSNSLLSVTARKSVCHLSHRFRSSVWETWPWTILLPPRKWNIPRSCCATYSPITLANISSINLVL
jgi:hypothetical protein